MDLNDWILAFHLISAVALIAAVTMFSVMIVALWRTDDPAAVTSFMRLGMVGTIVFGVWLAISVDRYELWDGWVIAAIVLWAIAMALGRQTGEGYRATAEMAAQLVSSGSPRSPELAAAMGTSRAFWTHWLSFVVIVLILIDMIWKPGA